MLIMIMHILKLSRRGRSRLRLPLRLHALVRVLLTLRRVLYEQPRLLVVVVLQTQASRVLGLRSLALVFNIGNARRERDGHRRDQAHLRRTRHFVAVPLSSAFIVAVFPRTRALLAVVLAAVARFLVVVVVALEVLVASRGRARVHAQVEHEAAREADQQEQQEHAEDDLASRGRCTDVRVVLVLRGFALIFFASSRTARPRRR